MADSALLPYDFCLSHQLCLCTQNHDRPILFHVTAIPVTVWSEICRLIDQPFTVQRIDAAQLAEQLGKTFNQHLTGLDTHISNLGSHYDLQALADELPVTADLLAHQDDAPIIQLINALLSEAIRERASDIHVEVYELSMHIRFRIDGQLRPALSPPRLLAPLILTRLKVMAKLDLAEKRLPQDGRISLRIANQAIDVRTSTIPTQFGERIVLRLLNKTTSPLTLTQHSFAEPTRAQLSALIHKPHGIILMTGPTGSGKTTTLYTLLNTLNQGKANIMTIEDPIEYDFDGIGQTQVNHKIGMTFARGLRAILRQDPDIIMVGEIRDIETAQMAVQASLTGHLVLSTLHTNSALGAVTRLRDMGIESFLLASTLIGVGAQRLVRKLCHHCRQASKVCPWTPSGHATIYQPLGCSQCHQSGYRGQCAIYEVVTIDAALQTAIHQQASEQQLHALARENTLSLLDHGHQLVEQGITSVEELLRVTQEQA